MVTKRELRAMMSAQKKEYGLEVRLLKSAVVFDKLKQTRAYREARNVLCYWSLPDEVYTHDFIAETAAEKRVYLPVVCGESLLLREYNGVGEMVEGQSFSILEPNADSPEVDVKQIDLVIVPGVAFDNDGGRLGRGKGYYDRLLESTNVYKIGVCFDFQIVDSVPCDAHDIRMNEVICG